MVEGRMKMVEEWPAAVSRSRRVRVDESGHRRRWPTWTHQKSFTQGAREDWYGQVWFSSGMEVVEARMKVQAAVFWFEGFSVTGLSRRLSVSA